MQNYKILNIPKMKLYYEGEKERTDDAVHTISFVGGTMLLEGEPVHSYYGKGVYYWEREDEKGCLWMRHFGLMGEGFIEKHGVRHNIKAAAETVYSLSYVKDKKETALEFILGVDFDSAGGSMTYCKLKYGGKIIVDYNPKEKVEQKILNISLTKEGNLHIDVDLSTYWSIFFFEMPQGFYAETLSMNFDATYNNVTGQVKETDQGGGSGKTFDLRGRISEEDIQKLRRTRRMFQMDSTKNRQLKGCFLANVNAVGFCSIDELFSLKAPTSIIEDGKEITGQQQVQRKAVETLYYLAVYHTAQMEEDGVNYETLFGIKKEFAKEQVKNVDPQILSLLKDKEVTDFLEKYAKVSIGNAVASSTDVEMVQALNGVSDPLGRCRYYMSGNTSENSMGKEPGFNTAMTFITKYVYASMVPNLRKYYDSGEDWGKELYEYSIRRLAMLKAQDLAGTSRITHIAMMLGFLNDKKQNITYKDGEEEKTVQLTYGSALYLYAFNMSLAEVADKVIFNTDDHANFINMMKQVFGVLYDELQKEESDKLTQEILKELKEDMSEFKKMTSASYIDSCLEVAEEVMNVAVSGGDLLMCISCIGKKYANNPKMNLSGKMVSLALIAFSLFQSGRMFADWKDLTWEEQAESVCVFIAGVANAGEVLARWKAVKTLLKANASITDKVNAATILKYGGENFDIIAGAAKAGGTELIETAESASRYAASVSFRTQESAMTQLGKFTRFFRVAEIVVRIVNLLILGFTAVMIGLDVAEDFKIDRQGAITAMDTLSLIFTGAAFIVEGVSLILDLVGVVCEAIPVIGAACTVLGLIFNVVSMILKAYDQSKGIRFIKEKIVPFIRTLAPPPENVSYVYE